MISRFAGSSLGLLAFAVAIFAGLSAGNPVTVILSRALWALLIFCIIGVVLGAAAQAVVNEHRRHREEAALSSDTRSPAPLDAPPPDHSTQSSPDPQPMGT